MSDAELAPLLCAGNTVYQALLQTGAQPGDVVVIQGLGGLGHLGLQYANKMGFIVVAYSGSPEKKELALKLGAHHYISSKDDVSNKIEAFCLLFLG